MSRELGRRKPSIVESMVNSTMEKIRVELVQLDRVLPTKCPSLGLLRVVIQPYQWFSRLVIEYQVLSLL